MTEMRVLNVAEKPSVAKEVARILSNNTTTSDASCAQYIRNWNFQNFVIEGRTCEMMFTSVIGHLMEMDFEASYRKWSGCDPADLFHANIHKTIPQGKRQIERNLISLARSSQMIILWLDCDREGENIAFEVLRVCQNANPRLIVKRARFSALTYRDLRHAIEHLIAPNELDSLAVDARQEIDLRAGCAFTRFQTLLLQKKFDWSSNGVNSSTGSNLLLSYGPCQFPTLGLIVERAWNIEAHIEEPFWYIFLSYEDEAGKCEFEWSRHRLFDQFSADLLYSFCADNPEAVVTKLDGKEKKKWSPYPLSTLELQKVATSALKISGERIMKYAEELYNAGFISYPRTETDGFPASMNLKSLVQQQTGDGRWGGHARAIMSNEMWQNPRNGGHDDKAHPPIHPTKYSAGEQNWDDSKKRVYEFIVRRFLACCSKDAIGHETSVQVDVSGELFTTKGLIVLERNWLEVYPYEKWGGTSSLPNFTLGQVFEPKEMFLKEGRTQPPPRLTEKDLIGKMEEYGIGTDATVAEHIQKQLDRGYAVKNAQLQFSATALGEGLILSYCNMGLEGLWKPDLRGKIEQAIREISTGQKTKQQVLEIALSAFQSDFHEAQRKSGLMVDAMGMYFRQQDSAQQQRVPLLRAQSATAERGRRGRRGSRARGRGRGRSRGQGGNTEVPLCPLHGLPVLVLTANTAQNAGRVFYKCSQDADRDACLSFQWADEFSNEGSTSRQQRGRSRGQRGNRGRGR